VEKVGKAKEAEKFLSEIKSEAYFYGRGTIKGQELKDVDVVIKNINVATKEEAQKYIYEKAIKSGLKAEIKGGELRIEGIKFDVHTIYESSSYQPFMPSRGDYIGWGLKEKPVVIEKPFGLSVRNPQSTVASKVVTTSYPIPEGGDIKIATEVRRQKDVEHLKTFSQIYNKM